MKILLAIPCYNCSPQIQRSLPKIFSLGLPESVDLLLVDNASTDDTDQVIRRLLKEAPRKENIRLLQHTRNYGLGGSFKTIVAEAQTGGYNYLVLFHGDDQATTEDLLMMIDRLKQYSPDCIFGARFMKGSRLFGYSKIREWGNKAINAIFSLALGTKIQEIGSGLNAYKVNALPLEEIPHWPDHIAFDLNLLFHFLDSDIPRKVDFMPIGWHEKDQRSNANNILVGLQVLGMLLSHLLGRKNLVKNPQTRTFEVIRP